MATSQQIDVIDAVFDDEDDGIKRYSKRVSLAIILGGTILGWSAIILLAHSAARLFGHS